MRGQHSPLAVWQTDSKQWQTIAGWQQLQELMTGYRNNNQKTLCLYFPSTHLLQVETELSSSQLKQLGSTGKQYLFEESSIAPVEQLVVKQNISATNHHLYALAQGDIESWQQSATLVGLSITALLPDFLLLSVPEEGAGQQVIMYQDEYTSLLRQSPQQGMAVSYLPSVFERLPHLSEVCLLSQIVPSDQTTFQAANAEFDTQIHTLLSEKQIVLTELPIIPIPIETPERHALNFFVKTSDNKLSPYLRVAALVALCALVLQMATDGVQLYRYNTASIETQAAVATQFQSWFPEDRLNPNSQLQTQMDPKLDNNSQASASHIAVLSRISPLIKQSSLKAQTLIMQPTALNFTLIAPNRESLDEFTSTLVSQGLDANLERVNGSENGEFSGQVTVNVVDTSTDNSSATAAVL
jgi:general secretion pathway protein L